ncbi:unnamed protein product [Adineta steineri]|uniref:Uncharacterized protein n=1 Tax=Adineta steineri TaxID=433720 RepID=A0A819IN47_9BILA|nr:unnamed protein product [Adineta steineri]CAF3920582.1 unnamed protein product [Adineta steineri]
MTSLCECPFLNRTFTIDDITKRSHCKSLKFRRAFQFLQLLLIQRVYGIDVITCPTWRRSAKHSQRELQQQHNYEVFLGGSCNPTTWRRDQAIPYFQSRSVSFYNPQVADWTPELVEIEHRAKELAPLLFFVIDHDTRALASIVEVCYLAARGRSIIVVMNPMPERKYTKFIQQKNSSHEKDNEDDYENVCEARKILRALLQSINVPFFDNVRLALECAAYILETTKRTVANQSVFNEDNKEDANDEDVLTPLPNSASDCEDSRPSSVVVIRSLSNKTTFDSPDDFYRQMHQSTMTVSSPPLHRRHSSTPDPNAPQTLRSPVCTRSQLSCSTTESDDDGYGSLSSSNRTLSSSSLSVSSESFESTLDQQHEENILGSNQTLSTSMINNVISTFYSYIPFVSSSKPSDSSVTQSLFVLCTLPFRFIKDTILPPISPPPSPSEFSPSKESTVLNSSSPMPLLRSPSYHMFDLYIASGTTDECWLNTFALPTLKKMNITFTTRQAYHDREQFDTCDDMRTRKQSRVLYYLINGNERLSYLTTELAFLIGEHKHKIIVYFQSNIDEDTEHILSACERRDIQRSRKYLEDLVRKENITLCHSRERSLEQVLDFFH